MAEGTYMNLPFNEFKASLEILINEAAELLKLEITDSEALNVLKHKRKIWEDQVKNLLQNSFSKLDNEYVKDFYSATSNSFNIGSEFQLEYLVKIQKETIKAKQYSLWGNLRIISVSDAIKSPNDVELRYRLRYTTEEKLLLLLTKLYELYDDHFYPIKELLIGNGIILKRYDEDRELAETLEERGLIKIYQGIGHDVMAQLTVEGAIFVEEDRKPINEKYDSIKNTQNELEDKVNEIIEYLKKLGYGQEIIFDELQELKEFYQTLNKKNWGQLLKGKLIDLSLAKLIENDTIKFIYESLTDKKLLL